MEVDVGSTRLAGSLSTQEVYGLTSGSKWRHVLAGFKPITVHDQAVAFSAALETEGLTDAPVGNQRVAELYQKTVGVHLAAWLEAKKVDGLVFNISAGGSNPSWSHGECVVRNKDDARKFSDALRANELLDARPGDARVRSTARKSKSHGHIIFAEVRPSHLLISTGQETVR